MINTIISDDKNLVAAFVVGSRMRGLPTPNSDIDLQIIGLEHSDNVSLLPNCVPDGIPVTGQIDLFYSGVYDLPSSVRRGEITQISNFFSDEIHVVRGYEKLIEHYVSRKEELVQAAPLSMFRSIKKNHFLNVSLAEKLVSLDRSWHKPGMYALYFAYMAHHFAESGDFETCIRADSIRDFLMSIRTGGLSFEEARKLWEHHWGKTDDIIQAWYMRNSNFELIDELEVYTRNFLDSLVQ